MIFFDDIFRNVSSSIGILQRKQLYLENGVVQLWARLADQGRSLNKVRRQVTLMYTHRHVGV